MQLAIDTSTNTASLALARGSEILAELSWRCGQNHSTTLLPNLANLLSQTSSGPGSLDAIIVARGPGSFNGLRVGISTAKGLAFSLGIPVVGISTLAATAYQHAETGLPVCPVFNAGRGEIATAIYHVKGSKWQPIISEHITTGNSDNPTTLQPIYLRRPHITKPRRDWNNDRTGNSSRR
jgi:tRNA threonylcarbamoyladenosine biosynthesis protein TsaB